MLAIVELAKGLILILSFGIAGYALQTMIDSKTDQLTLKLAIAFPLGSGVVSFLVFLLSIFKVPVDSAIVIGIMIGTAIGIGVLIGRKSRTGPSPQRSLSSKKIRFKWDFAPLLGVFALILVAYWLSVLRSYSTWDAIAIWSVKGYGIVRAGSILAAAEWGSHGLDYPLNLPIQIATFYQMGVENLPGSKLLFPSYFASLLAGCYAFWRSIGGSIRSAGLGVLWLSSIPVVFDHATIGYANLPFTTLLVLGTFSIVTGFQSSKLSSFVFCGILLGLASWTRPEGLPIIALLYLLLILYGVITKTKIWRGLVVGFIPLIIISGAWIAFSSVYSSDSDLVHALQSTRGSVLEGDFHLPALYWITRYVARQAISPSVWGLSLLFVVLLSWRQFQKIRRFWKLNLIPLYMVSIIVTLSIIGFYYLTSFIGDVQFWLGTGVNRMFLPAALLTLISLYSLEFETLGAIPSSLDNSMRRDNERSDIQGQGMRADTGVQDGNS